MSLSDRVVREILPSVLVYLASPELQRLAKTCRYMHAVVASRSHLLYNIDVLLGQFFLNTAEFRFLQACTGLLISGSQALQFLDRRTYGSYDMDLYVEACAALVVIDWLLLQGYILMSRRSPFRRETLSPRDRLWQSGMPGGPYFLRTGHILFQFVSACGSRKIDLIVTTGSAFSAICDFHSIIVMNFISAHCAVSVFAYTTFVKRWMVVGLSYWYRMGLTLAARSGGVKVICAEFGYDGLHNYCVPKDFACREVAQEVLALLSADGARMDDIVDTIVLARVEACTI
ncbi:hypothetical protein AURDEDRAFT_121978 [Auricularia subglabra TFB-10046 SS5]|nr:hypothetical protein AURDEDRAFT_121978 [Auricularia subglabra TFB-10046 SS5]